MTIRSRDLQPPGFLVRYDCRHYSGYKPCGVNPVCQGCDHYDPAGQRILVIKLAAMGDVLRTTPILPALRREYPRAHITWLTRPESRGLLRCNPHLDRLLVWGLDATLILEAIPFDLVLNFEKDLAALALAERLHVREHRGFRLTNHGTVGIADECAAEALRLGLDDHHKFHVNTKPMQQIVCEMAGLSWDGTLYHYVPSPRTLAMRQSFAQMHPELAGKMVIGVSTGCGPGFPTKQWAMKNVLDLLKRLSERPGTVTLLLGGEREAEFNRRILQEAGGWVIDTGCHNTFEDFAGILLNCSAVVAADSMPVHLATALDVPAVALFGPTTPREVDLGPRGEKVVTDFECSPCYRTRCDKSPLCMEAMGADLVAEAIERVLVRAAPHP
ncbi:MAG: glycosyltransferase family 9 protein [Candidatus Sumerlaeia bacterium]|nr:glycosyltransferase family 9 protein [Candidatus Sumerlaeia bacterium]